MDPVRGPLKGRAGTMRRARILRGLMLAAGLGWLNVVAIGETWRLATTPIPGPSSGPMTDYRMSEGFADGRAFDIRKDVQTGQVLARTQVRSWTWPGQFEVWWPVVAALGFSLLAIWFARRRAWIALLEVFWFARPTIGRWMIAVAILGGECGATFAWLRSIRADPLRVDWPAILIFVAALNLSCLLPIGIALSYRRRDPGKGP